VIPADALGEPSRQRAGTLRAHHQPAVVINTLAPAQHDHRILEILRVNGQRVLVQRPHQRVAPIERYAARCNADVREAPSADAERQREALEQKFGDPRKASLTWRPQNTVAVDDEQGEKVLKLIENLNEQDDVQNVYANFEISDALLSKMSA